MKRVEIKYYLRAGDKEITPRTPVWQLVYYKLRKLGPREIDVREYFYVCSLAQPFSKKVAAAVLRYLARKGLVKLYTRRKRLYIWLTCWGGREDGE